MTTIWSNFSQIGPGAASLRDRRRRGGKGKKAACEAREREG